MGLLLWEITAETRANRKTTPDCAVDVKIQSSNFKFELPTTKTVKIIFSYPAYPNRIQIRIQLIFFLNLLAITAGDGDSCDVFV